MIPRVTLFVLGSLKFGLIGSYRMNEFYILNKLRNYIRFERIPPKKFKDKNVKLIARP